MRMYIPAIGDEIILISDWTFGLWNERRNFDLMELVGDTRTMSWRVKISSIPCTIPKGSTLKIDRLYIRKGVSDYDSVTFYWKGVPPKPRAKSKRLRAVRFWVKLEDANKIEFADSRLS
jgi:hypothetical protein